MVIIIITNGNNLLKVSPPTVCWRISGVQKSQQFEAGFLVELHHCIIQRVFVFIQPARNAVVHSAGIVHKREVSLCFAFDKLGLLEIAGFTQVLVVQLVFEGSVWCLRKHALLFKDGKDSHWLVKTKTIRCNILTNCYWTVITKLLPSMHYWLLTFWVFQKNTE